MMNRDISDDTIKENTQANPYYVGTSFEANEDACDYMTQILTEDGRTQVGLGKVAAGSSLSNRNDYFTEAAKNTVQRFWLITQHLPTVQHRPM